MACAELIEKGAITSSSKGFDDGYMIAAELWSTEPMLKWVDRNPSVLMAPARYSHGAEVLAQIARFVAIQSAVEVALDGAANSETAGGRVLSGPGGAPDYAFAASVAVGGRSILALKSVTGDGSISRIVHSIESPNRVTLPYYARALAARAKAEIAGAWRAIELRSVDLVSTKRRCPSACCAVSRPELIPGGPSA